MTNLNGRVNLILSMATCIQIEKESEKRGITRTQYIKESIQEKINKADNYNLENEINFLKEEIRELKTITITILEKTRQRL